MDGKESEEVEKEFQEARIEVVIGPDVEVPNTDNPIEEEIKDLDNIVSNEESKVEKIKQDLEYQIKVLN